MLPGKRDEEYDCDSASESSLSNLFKEVEETTSEKLTKSMDGEYDSDEDSGKMSDSCIAELTKSLPQSTDKTAMKALDSFLDQLQPKYRNSIVRLIFSLFMIGGFSGIIYLGPSALMALTILIQVICFYEIISVGFAVYKMHKFPWIRTLSWYFLIAVNYFCSGENLMACFGILLNGGCTRFFIAYHRFIAFSVYMCGLIYFILHLVKGHYMSLFNLLAWIHVVLILVVVPSYFVLQNLFEGVIWYLVPVSLIICNDIFAYICGFFFGRTPLIQLSPKKTWEGFIGGGIFTIIFGFIVSEILCKYKCFICPVVCTGTHLTSLLNCVPSPIFQVEKYQPPWILSSLLLLFGHPTGTISLHPFTLHCFAFSLFGSIIGPFGGFFASGFKRAFKVKDFGDIIPGHGGFSDRFDCQLLMGIFVHVYVCTFIHPPDANRVLKQIFMLNISQQVEVFYGLKKHLSDL